MTFIKKIKLQNFKRFRSFEVEFDEKLNLLIGDNEAGKSSVLQAINLVLTGSRAPIDALGLDNLFNVEVISDFISGERTYAQLPILLVELYFNDTGNFNLSGNVNSDNRMCDGLRLLCAPDPDFAEPINQVLAQANLHFPFEYYSISFTTFDGTGYSPYKKFLRHLLIDSSLSSDEYALRGYIKNMYSSTAETLERNKHLHEYRKRKSEFRDEVLQDVNARMTDGYQFSIRNNSKANLETDLTLTIDEVALENQGRGKQSMIKTEFAVNRNNHDLDVLLLEEPENHLSHINMNKLIQTLRGADEKQLILTTHNSLIAARLDLRHTFLFNSSATRPLPMKSLPEPVAKFFMKAPDSNILEFVLSKKVILVEGNAEYILIKTFFENHTGSALESSGIHIISVGGLSFPQYMTVAAELGIKTAVIRDNDGNHQQNCVELYTDLVNDHIRVFSDTDNQRTTLEVCLYKDNTAICDGLFSAGRRTLTVQEYMLKNKSECAFRLADEKGTEIVVPQYIANAITWINE